MHCSKYRKFVPAFIRIRNMATVKRFYRKTNILSSGGKYEISLDQRKLKTPHGRVFEVDSKPLALAVAMEWDNQRDIIDKGSMHLTAMCNTVIDNPRNQSKMDMVNYIVNCLETDTILFQSSDSEELYKLQAKHWDPLVQWFCDNYGVNIIKTLSISAPAIPPETKATMTRHLMSYDYSAIHGFTFGVDAIKSVILTLAATNRAISIQEAVKLSCLEEDYQTSHWGSVEWFHDRNKQDLQARLSAAILFVHLNSYSTTSRPKIANPNVG